ncbi:hypothetical protein BKA70DRAFT_1186235 [Coprinopsis sp. MPI-PUGE-AT-0042]|nr:hypothetical protein BKA70DRAFT_1186235 [Coprinopsis sp. MPI-PUGE-AT-0042]
MSRSRPLHDLYDNALGLFKPAAVLCFLSVVAAGPVAQPGANEVLLQRGEDSVLSRRANEDNSEFNTKLWIPVIVFLVLVVSTILINQRIRLAIISLFRGRTPPSQSQSESANPRELTAEQLAGTINGGGTTEAAAPRTRRNRRRRRPSQMSVTSLPEYNKEPGEQELVVIRGTDSEDAPVATVAREDDVESSINHGNSSRYSATPSSPHDTPLLDDFNQRGVTTAESQPANPPSASTTSLLNEDAQDDSRGEAPPYFEVVEETVSPFGSHDASSSPPQAQDSSNLSPTNTPERRSGIRTFFNRMSVVGAPRGFTHGREDSTASNQSHIRSPSAASGTGVAPSPSRHRTTPSSTSSFFRGLSRQKSQSTMHSGNGSGRLNSPSMISLNSISSPLTHTAVRTEFAYPKSGPTPEQLKMISSRESIARFAVPYGADAIAYASSSRLDVSSPPPDFDAAFRSGSPLGNINASSTSLHVRNESGGNARRPASPSPLAQVSSRGDGSASFGQTASRTMDPRETSTASSSSSPANQSEPQPVTVAPEQSIASKDHALPYNAETTASTSPNDASPPGMPVNEFGTLAKESGRAASPTSAPASPSDAKPISAAESIAARYKTLPFNGTSQSYAYPSSPAVSEFGSLARPGNAPPSSFNSHLAVDRPPTAASGRSESRASMWSHQTFETAAESIGTRRTDTRQTHRDSFGMTTDDDGETDYSDAESRPGTPVGRGHLQEPTDSTVVPGGSRNSNRDTIIAPRP